MGDLDLSAIFHVLQTLVQAEGDPSEVQAEHLQRVYRLSKVLSQFATGSLREIDSWLTAQENGEKGLMLTLLTGYESGCHLIHPEAVFNPEDCLSDESRVSMRLNRKRMQHRKSA